MSFIHPETLMNNVCFRPGVHAAAILILSTLFAVNAAAQDSYLNASGDGAGFSGLSFGVGLPDLTGISGAKEETFSAAALLTNANGDVDPLWASDGQKVVGWVSVQTTVKKDWHVYAPTQGPGGLPTKFKDLAIDGTGADALSVGEFRLASPIVMEKDEDGQPLEELLGTIDWLAPLYAAADAGDLDLTNLTVTGTISALACSNGDGGACVPQNVDFKAKYADKDVAEILATIETSAPTQTKTDAPEKEPVAADKETSPEIAAPETKKASRGFLSLLLTAFFGGLILNVTPCVLPVVGLKILSFFEQAGRSRANAFLLNVWYAVGVLIVFGALAFASVGLSFLFTRALFQIIMSAIVFTMALSLMGVWELQTPSFLGGERSNQLTSKEGPVGAIFKGVITTLLAIPCGAPLLSPALNWASEMTRQGEMGLVVLVYLVIGLGMASPFLIAGAFPELLKFFPKPGEWMETFRKAMGFFLLIAVVWILYSAPLEYVLPTIAFLFALWFACWNVGRNQYEFENPKKKVVGWIVSVAVVAVVGLFAFNLPGAPVKTTLQNASVAKATRWAIRANRAGALTQEHWALFDRATLDRELAAGRAVAVDFTADWCMNCKFLEKTILHTPEVEAVFDEKNILTLTADWTNQDAKTPDVLAINELLDAAGARQVPTLMIFFPEDPEHPVVLQGLYTKSALLAALGANDAE